MECRDGDPTLFSGKGGLDLCQNFITPEKKRGMVMGILESARGSPGNETEAFKRSLAGSAVPGKETGPVGFTAGFIKAASRARESSSKRPCRSQRLILANRPGALQSSTKTGSAKLGRLIAHCAEQRSRLE
jgi:hypothetical protein